MNTLSELQEQGLIDNGTEQEVSGTITFKNTAFIEVVYHQKVTPAWRPGRDNSTYVECLANGVLRMSITQQEICGGTNCGGHRQRSENFTLDPGTTTLQLNYQAGKWSASGTRWNMHPQLRIIADGVLVYDKIFEISLDPYRRTLAPGTVRIQMVQVPA